MELLYSVLYTGDKSLVSNESINISPKNNLLYSTQNNSKYFALSGYTLRYKLYPLDVTGLDNDGEFYYKTITYPEKTFVSYQEKFVLCSDYYDLAGDDSQIKYEYSIDSGTTKNWFEFKTI